MSLLIWINATIFVAACFILLYWHVIIPFLPLLKQGYLFNLLLLWHFASLRETLMFEECFVQFKLNVTPATLLNFGGTTQKEIEISIYVLRFLSGPPRRLFQILVKKGQYRLSSTWCYIVLWDVVLLVLVLFWINVELKLLNCCLLPLSEQ